MMPGAREPEIVIYLPLYVYPEAHRTGGGTRG
jgi:hypothetical protein